MDPFGGLLGPQPTGNPYTFANTSKPVWQSTRLAQPKAPGQAMTAPPASLGQMVQNKAASAVAPVTGQRFANNLADLLDYTPLSPVSQGFQAGQDLGHGQIKSGLGNFALAAFGAVPETNYLSDLGRYAPKLFRETSLDQAQYFIPKSNSYTDLRHGIYLADTPDLALGQGSNRGVLMEFNAGGLQGQINTAKPSWKPQWESGNAEYVAKYNPQTAYQNNMTAFTVHPDALSSAGISGRERLGRTMRQLEGSGWSKSVNPDGSIRFDAPELEAK